MENDKVYKVIELVGSSPNSWEDAVQAAVKQASESIRDIRIVEVDKLDVKITDGEIVAYRARIKLSFKYHKE